MIPTTVRSGGGVGMVRVSLPGVVRAPTTVRCGRSVGLVWVSTPAAGRALMTVRSGSGVGLVRISLPGVGRSPTMVRSGSGVGLDRVSLPGARRAPKTVRTGGGMGLVRASLPGAGRTVGRLPPSGTKPAKQEPQGYLKGAAFAGLLTCYKRATGAALCYLSNDPSASSLNDPSSHDNASLHQKLDVVLEQINQLHQKLNMMGIKQPLWRILCPVFSFFCILLITIVLYIFTDVKVYVEAESNKLAKAMFFSFANDAKVKKSLDKLIEDGMDISFYHIVSLRTWYRWLRGM